MSDLTWEQVIIAIIAGFIIGLALLSCAPQRAPEPLLTPDTTSSEWRYVPNDSVRAWISEHRLDTSYLHWPWDSTAPE